MRHNKPRVPVPPSIKDALPSSSGAVSATSSDDEWVTNHTQMFGMITCSERFSFTDGNYTVAYRDLWGRMGNSNK